MAALVYHLKPMNRTFPANKAAEIPIIKDPWDLDVGTASIAGEEATVAGIVLFNDEIVEFDIVWFDIMIALRSPAIERGKKHVSSM
jgi:hypothetical protein